MLKMKDRLDEVLSGALGFFWQSSGKSFPYVENAEERHGYVALREGLVRVHLLRDDPMAYFSATGTVPDGLIAATEAGGVVVLDVASAGAANSFGGSRSSIDHYTAHTVVQASDALDATSARLTEASVYFSGDALLVWSDLQAVDKRVDVDQSNRIERVQLDFVKVPTAYSRLTTNIEIYMGAYWSADQDPDAGHAIVTALELGARSSRPKRSADLLFPLTRCQDVLSLAFNGFLTAHRGRAQFDGGSERGHMWNSTLMPSEIPSGVDAADRRSSPIFSAADIGGVDGLRRWIQLYKRYPRALAPVVGRIRRGAASPETELTGVAVGLEQWCAKHRRHAAWPKRGDNPAEAVGLHIGHDFAEWCGDTTKWAEAVWSHYNGLKHDPSFTYERRDVAILAESAYLLLVAALLNRAATTKTPSRRYFAGSHNRRLGEEVRKLVV